MARYCPTCGKSDAIVQFHGEMCVDCARERIGNFPTIRVRVCQKCGEVIGKDRKVKGIKFADEVSRQLKIKSSNPKYGPEFATVEYDTHYGRFTQNITVLSDKFQCLMCARAGSQYFEAIIQLRGGKAPDQKVPDVLLEQSLSAQGETEESLSFAAEAKSRIANEEKMANLARTEKKMEKIARFIIRRIESRSFIPKIEELKEGIDIYCGSRAEAISALNAYELGFVRTEKLAGEKNGKRLYRTTLLVRI